MMESYSEYDEPKAMVHTYCQQIAPAQYEKHGAIETEKALRDLMDYLEMNPSAYKKVLVRQKQEEAENAGIFSYVKCKFLATVRGPDYMEDAVSNDETLFKIGQLQHELAKVYDYGQEANKSKKRFSRRIAAKKAAARNKENTTPANFKRPNKVSSSSKRTAPPPPAYPPPPVSSPATSGDDDVFVKSVLAITPCRRPPIHPPSSTPSVDCSIPPPPPPPPANVNRTGPLKERINNQVSLESPTYKSTPIKPGATPNTPRTPGIHSELKRYGSSTSLSSIASVHDELRSFDKTRLKSVSTKTSKRSPRSKSLKTPLTARKRVLSASIVRASITDVCGISTISAFNQQMVDKFRNARSPVTAVNSPASSFNSPTGFTP
ncbi:uncharacterized protein At4g04980-like [Patiria miniata]|uniref:Uncharacterized protein n=1 Tax=Patiria miniata TaxID=46514 RepID=A0A914A2D4_PATMI|nr:uncharacterized protein At4g04980-like [Patiria miniata]XP_038058007.1 uncharacterized protein At4g04980-like [Patiria miniata]